MSRKQLKYKRLVVVSHRGPVTVEHRQGQTRYRRGAGGLVAALTPVFDRRPGLWIAAGKSPLGHPPGEPFSVPGDLKTELLHIPVPPRLREQHYLGFSNRALWPIAHGFPNVLRFRRSELAGYLQVNEMFAQAILEHTRPTDAIWIHDYQLAALPVMIRAERPEARISFFWHVPFPGYEVFRALPYHRELLEGMLGADYINFHLDGYAGAMREAVRSLLGAKLAGDRAVTWQGRKVIIGAQPIGIDVERWKRQGENPRVLKEAERIREECASRCVILGVDRLDYTKGMLERIRAVEYLLEHEPWLRGEFSLVQIAVPSRTRVPEYREMRREIDETVGRVNGRFSEGPYVPIHYFYRSVPPDTLAAYYRAADIGLITPLRDGMNLVGMEFVAANADRSPVLVLSELAGASEILKGAVLVNPYDTEGVADGIRTALQMPEEERAKRADRLKASVAGHSVHDWAGAVLGQLFGEAPQPDGIDPDAVVEPEFQELPAP